VVVIVVVVVLVVVVVVVVVLVEELIKNTSASSYPALYPSLLPSPSSPLSLLLSVDGIRTFSMLWVVMGHLLVFPSMLVGFTNSEKVLPPDGIMATVSGR